MIDIEISFTLFSKFTLKIMYDQVSRVVKYPRTDGEETVPDNIPMSFIQDGHKFDLGDLTLKAYHTPGHTTDSIILHLEACTNINKLLFCFCNVYSNLYIFFAIILGGRRNF